MQLTRWSVIEVIFVLAGSSSAKCLVWLALTELSSLSIVIDFKHFWAAENDSQFLFQIGFEKWINETNKHEILPTRNGSNNN